MTTTITVLGAGYVGLSTAALLAQAGFKVYLVEPNPSRLDTIKQGRSFFFEAGLDPIIKLGIDSGNLLPTDSYNIGVPESDFVFSCVGTPDNPDGSSNLAYVYDAAKSAAKLMKPGAVFIQKSTVPVGTGKKIIEKLGLEAGSYISNPEFLREGTALQDTLWFDRIVCGGSDESVLTRVAELYKALEAHRDTIATAAGIEIGSINGSYIATDLNSAELIKVTANAFLALKISFANSIAKLSDAVDADINGIMDAVGADKRIGRAFLNAGRGYGGGCFPKDVSGLISSGLEHGIDLEIMQAAQQVNESMPSYVIEKLKHQLGGNLSGKKIAVLGLAFKKGTSDTRKSPGVKIANLLNTFDVEVLAYDPQALEEAKQDLRRNVLLCTSIEEALVDCDAVVLATDWDELMSLPAQIFANHLNSGAVVIDAVNAYRNHIDLKNLGLDYIGIGR